MVATIVSEFWQLHMWIWFVCVYKILENSASYTSVTDFQRRQAPKPEFGHEFLRRLTNSFPIAKKGFIYHRWWNGGLQEHLRVENKYLGGSAEEHAISLTFWHLALPSPSTSQNTFPCPNSYLPLQGSSPHSTLGIHSLDLSACSHDSFLFCCGLSLKVFLKSSTSQVESKNEMKSLGFAEVTAREALFRFPSTVM